MFKNTMDNVAVNRHRTNTV